MNRRSFLTAAGSLLAAGTAGMGAVRPLRPHRFPRPSPAQLLWQRDERALFVHFGINTFTDREWGDGTEDPGLFDPSDLDPRRWTRLARETGFRAVVLTAKHHDGFCLWPTATTDHSVAASPWRGGGGDLVREFVDACRSDGLRPGLYCSPWDRNHPTYGDSPRYNAVYRAQLTELLTRYGPIHEVWFDGANGEGPDGRRQEYDWPATWALVRDLQPEAVIFSDAGPDVRWIGNEIGSAGDPNWSTVDPAVVPAPGMSGDAVMRQLQHGDPDGTVWRPGETDVSIRPGWFHHPGEDGRVRSVENLVDLHFTSVGRNSKLLLNVPPTRTGRIHDTDAARLRGLRARLDALFERDLAAGRPGTRIDTGPRTARMEVTLARESTVGIVDLAEPIEGGQSVAAYRVEGRTTNRGWVELAAGQTIGYRKLDRVTPASVDAVRVTLEDLRGPPPPVRLALRPPG